MARARNIKPGFFKNEELAELSPEVRLLFIGLWTLADREGRLEDRPKRIKAELFAFDSFDVDSMLSELQTSMFITRYEVGSARFVAITNFVKHQDPHYRERASEIPPPNGASNSIVATNVTRTQRARIFDRDGYRCKKCNTTEQLSVDHVVAVANGGDSQDSNLQVLCYSCNFDKGAKVDRTSANVKSNMGQGTPPQPPLIPDSLIPDSLIPDTGFLIPESLPSSAATPACEPPAETARAAPPPEEKPKITTAGAWAVDLKRRGVTVTSMHPTLLAWIEDGFTLPQVIEALGIARDRKPEPEKVPAGYLDVILRTPPKRSEPAWWTTESGIVSKGKELGVAARNGESWDGFKSRIQAAIAAKKGGQGPIAGMLGGSA